MKKILAMVCVLALMLSMTVFGVSADEELYYGDFKYRITDGVAVITGIKEFHSSGDIVIPATIDECPVRVIGEYAFSYVSTIYSVEIPDSVTRIEREAFYSCDGLESAVIGNGVRELPERLFAESVNLQEVTLGEKVKTIGSSAFYDCVNLRKIDLLNVTEVKDSAFWNCTALTEVNIPQSNTVIGDSAFEKCDSLKSLDLSNVCTIGISAFCNCNSLVTVIIPESVSELVDPDYSDGAFEGCTALKNVVVMGSMTSIPMYTFENNDNLKNVFIDKGNLNYIDEYAFQGSYAIENVYFSGTEEEWKAISGDAAFSDEYFNNVKFHFNATYDEHLFDEVEDKGLLGDVNDDEKVNIKDATEIQKFAAKITDLDADAQLRADVNADEKVNVKDATTIQKYVAKIETGFAIGEAIK